MKFRFFCLTVFLFASNVFSQEQFAVYFDSDKHELKPAEFTKLNDWANLNKDIKVVAINGYTDEDGSNGYNDTLSKKRVEHVFAKIKSKVKIREDFKTRSFGENFNQSATKSENRKVTIYYILAKDLAREDEILGIKPKINEPEIIVPIEEESMNFPENATLEDKIALSKKGTLIRLNDINFHLNTFAIMPNSKPAIVNLVRILDKYPRIKIEIQGHICCVDKDIKNLSIDRAKQVRRILVYEGINERRIKVKGFGVSKPKFPIPEKSEFEAARNRRVEIMILDK